MTSNLKFRLLTIVAVILVCVYGIIGLPKSKAELIQNWKSNIRLGLDLSGGSHLIMEIHLQDAFKGEADAVIARLKDELGKAKTPISFVDMNHSDPQTIADANSTSNAMLPTKPNSSPKIVKMKSVSFSGKKLRRLCVP